MLRSLAERFTWKKNLVYSYSGVPVEALELPEDLEFAELDVALTERLFSSNEDYPRRMRYLDLLSKGCRGFVVYEGDSWASAGWVVPAGTRGMPAHLPRQAKGVPWFFEDHTKPQYRKRGLHTYLLRKRLGILKAEDPDADVVARSDVSPENVASRKSYTRAGFEPSGTVTTVRVAFPYLPPGPYGLFNRFAKHPKLHLSKWG